MQTFYTSKGWASVDDDKFPSKPKIGDSFRLILPNGIDGEFVYDDQVYPSPRWLITNDSI